MNSINKSSAAEFFAHVSDFPAATASAQPRKAFNPTHETHEWLGVRDIPLEGTLTLLRKRLSGTVVGIRHDAASGRLLPVDLDPRIATMPTSGVLRLPLRLDDETMAAARALGGGKASRGIRAALAALVDAVDRGEVTTHELRVADEARSRKLRTGGAPAQTSVSLHPDDMLRAIALGRVNGVSRWSPPAGIRRAVLWACALL